LHFQIGGLAVIKTDMDIQTYPLCFQVGRDKLIVYDPDTGYFAVSTGGEEATKCFAGILYPSI